MSTPYVFPSATGANTSFSGKQAYIFKPASSAWASFLDGEIIPMAQAEAGMSRPYTAAIKVEIQCFRPYSGAEVGRSLQRYYHSASSVERSMSRLYQSAPWVEFFLSRPYDSLLAVERQLSRVYSSLTSAEHSLSRPYAGHAMVAAERSLSRPYALGAPVLAERNLSRPYRSIEAAPPVELERYHITIAGQQIDPVRLSISISRQQSAINAELEVADEWAYLLAARHAPASIELWGYSFNLVVDGRARREAFGEHSYTILLASAAVQLEYPWAAKVEGELTGMASAIARQLAGSITLHWQTVDWYIMPGLWLAAAESPLALLQQLVSAAGAVLLSQPDGSLVVQPLYPVSVPAWPAATVTQHVSTASEVITLESGAEHREGINIITVSDQAAASDSLRIEEDTERKAGGITQVLVCQTPWRDDFELSHRGDTATAGISPMGIEERVITDEEIIIQDGEASAAYPVYAVVAARYNKLSLGTPTYSEDGKITTAIKGDSILLLSYRTRARRYQVRESMLNDLLVVAENTEAA